MRLRRAVVAAFVGILLSAAFFVDGCSGGNSTPSGGPSPGPTPIFNPSPSPGPTPIPTPTPTPTPTGSPTPTPVPAAASRFIYAILNFEAPGGYFGGATNSSTGAVTPLPQNPFPNTLGQNVVVQVITDPQARFLYSLNLGSTAGGQAGINEYQINQTSGVLTIVPASPITFSSGTHTAQLAIDGKGKFLYQADGGVTDIYSINQTTGALIFQFSTTAAVPVGTFSAASPDGRFIFNSGAGMVEAFAVNDVTGALTLASSPSRVGGSGGPMAVSTDSSLLFVASPEGRLDIFHIGANGFLTPIAGSPFVINTQAEAIALSPGAGFAYIIFGPPVNNVTGYAVNTAAGTVTQVPGPVIGAATSVSVDGSGKFAYVSLGRQLVTFTIDQTIGALTQTPETAVQPWTDDPTNIVVVP